MRKLTNILELFIWLIYKSSTVNIIIFMFDINATVVEKCKIFVADVNFKYALPLFKQILKICNTP